MRRGRRSGSRIAAAAALFVLCAPAALSQPAQTRPVTRAEFDRAIADLRREIAAGNFATRAEVTELHAQLQGLRERLNALRARLGLPPTPAAPPVPPSTSR